MTEVWVHVESVAPAENIVSHQRAIHGAFPKQYEMTCAHNVSDWDN